MPSRIVHNHHLNLHSTRLSRNAPTLTRQQPSRALNITHRRLKRSQQPLGLTTLSNQLGVQRCVARPHALQPPAQRRLLRGQVRRQMGRQDRVGREEVWSVVSRAARVVSKLWCFALCAKKKEEEEEEELLTERVAPRPRPAAARRR